MFGIPKAYQSHIYRIASTPLVYIKYARQLVLVVESPHGEELIDVILFKPSLSEDEARSVSVQVARALPYMHWMELVHRDVKPENVMIMDRPANDGLYPEVGGMLSGYGLVWGEVL